MRPCGSASGGETRAARAEKKKPRLQSPFGLASRAPRRLTGETSSQKDEAPHFSTIRSDSPPTRPPWASNTTKRSSAAAGRLTWRARWPRRPRRSRRKSPGRRSPRPRLRPPENRRRKRLRPSERRRKRPPQPRPIKRQRQRLHPTTHRRRSPLPGRLCHRPPKARQPRRLTATRRSMQQKSNRRPLPLHKREVTVRRQGRRRRGGIGVSRSASWIAARFYPRLVTDRRCSSRCRPPANT